MQIEFDLSAMINSLLKDCAYELECKIQETKFLITIPMTFENDFENSYNIYDLQAGSVTVIGINRGVRKHKKRMSLQDIFSEKDSLTKMVNMKIKNYNWSLLLKKIRISYRPKIMKMMKVKQ